MMPFEEEEIEARKKERNKWKTVNAEHKRSCTDIFSITEYSTQFMYTCFMCHINIFFLIRSANKTAHE